MPANHTCDRKILADKANLVKTNTQEVVEQTATGNDTTIFSTNGGGLVPSKNGGSEKGTMMPKPADGGGSCVQGVTAKTIDSNNNIHKTEAVEPVDFGINKAELTITSPSLHRRRRKGGRRQLLCYDTLLQVVAWWRLTTVLELVLGVRSDRLKRACYRANRAYKQGRALPICLFSDSHPQKMTVNNEDSVWVSEPAILQPPGPPKSITCFRDIYIISSSSGISFRQAINDFLSSIAQHLTGHRLQILEHHKDPETISWFFEHCLAALHRRGFKPSAVLLENDITEQHRDQLIRHPIALRSPALEASSTAAVLVEWLHSRFEESGVTARGRTLYTWEVSQQLFDLLINVFNEATSESDARIYTVFGLWRGDGGLKRKIYHENRVGEELVLEKLVREHFREEDFDLDLSQLCNDGGCLIRRRPTGSSSSNTIDYKQFKNQFTLYINA